MFVVLKFHGGAIREKKKALERLLRCGEWGQSWKKVERHCPISVQVGKSR